MFCKYCGKEIPDGTVCDCEGAIASATSNGSFANGAISNVAMRIKAVFTDQIFLITFGLYLVSLLRFVGESFNFWGLILPALILIFLFQFYSECKKKNDYLNTSALKRFGTVLQIYFVIFIIIAVLLGIASFLIISIDFSSFEELLSETGYTMEELTEEAGLTNIIDLFNFGISMIIKALGIIMLLFAAWMVVLAITMNKLKKFTLSVIDTIRTSLPVKYSIKSLIVLLYVVGISYVIFVFTNLNWFSVSSLGNLALAAVYILMTFIIKHINEAISNLDTEKVEG